MQSRRVSLSESTAHTHTHTHTEQNAINPTLMGLDRCQITEYSTLSDHNYTDLSPHR